MFLITQIICAKNVIKPESFPKYQIFCHKIVTHANNIKIHLEKTVMQPLFF